MSQRKIEMTWRCSSCSNTNLGRFKECQRCGDPKDSSEKYEMPGNTATAASVTDPNLLRMANAGANWQCAYCGSHQRKLDQSCAQCGAASAEGTSTRGATAAQQNVGNPDVQAALARMQSGRRPGWRSFLTAPFIVLGLMLACVGSAFAAVIVAAIFVDPPPPYLDYQARVTDVSWEQTVRVERYRIHDREGFREQLPSAALDVRSLGQRHHHDEQVLDGYDTQTYQEQEQQGFATETYTERVSCGQDCTTEPQSCSEHCTSDDNGFASCSTTCTGGGQSCTTRYCDEQRTRQVPNMVMVTKTRQVPRYRSEPRYAEAFAYKIWDWSTHRTLRRAGRSIRTEWPPPEEIALSAGLSEGEQEREIRDSTYIANLRDARGQMHRQTLQSAAALAAYAPGSPYRVRVHREGRVEILGPGIVDAGPPSR